MPMGTISDESIYLATMQLFAANQLAAATKKGTFDLPCMTAGSGDAGIQRDWAAAKAVVETTLRLQMKP